MKNKPRTGYIQQTNSPQDVLKVPHILYSMTVKYFTAWHISIIYNQEFQTLNIEDDGTIIQTRVIITSKQTKVRIHFQNGTI